MTSVAEKVSAKPLLMNKECEQMASEKIKMKLFKHCKSCVRYREQSAENQDGDEVESSVRDLYLQRTFSPTMPDTITLTVEG